MPDKLTHAKRIAIRADALNHAGMSYHHWPALARKQPNVTTLPSNRGEPSLDDFLDRARRIEVFLLAAGDEVETKGDPGGRSGDQGDQGARPCTSGSR